MTHRPVRALKALVHLWGPKRTVSDLGGNMGTCVKGAAASTRGGKAAKG